jgi:hypothetical protein
MVDTRSEYNWIPATTLHELGIAPVRIDRFETADGRVLEREVGFAMLYAGERSTPTIVVFAGPDDLVLLGAIGLEGLNLRVDLGRKQLVPAGPLPAAAMAALADCNPVRPEDSVALIREAVGHSAGAWADLGCGTGIFTRALADILGSPPTVIRHCICQEDVAGSPFTSGDVRVRQAIRLD